MSEKYRGVSTMPTSYPSYPQNIARSIAQPPFSTYQASGLSLVECIAEQNQIFKVQQQNIESQLIKLRKISMNLLNQNIQLRSLYKGRTQDISNFLNTITINTNQVIIDYQHQQFLIKQLNCGLLKHIKLLAKQAQSIGENIQIKSLDYQQIDKAKMNLEHQTVNKLRIKLNSNLNKRMLKQNQEKQMEQLNNVNRLSEQVINLVISNKELQLFLQHSYQSSNDLYGTLQKDKQQLADILQYLKAENKKYENQIINDEIDLKKVKQDLEYKQQGYRTTKNKVNAQINKFQKYQRRNLQIQTQIEVIKEKKTNSMKMINANQNKLDQAKYQKNQVLQKIKIAKGKIKQLQEQVYSKSAAINSSKQENIRKSRNAIQKKEQDYIKQVSEIKKQINKIQEEEKLIELETNNLQEKINKYKKLIEQFINPVKEIEKILFKDKYKKNKIDWNSN